MQMKYSHYIQLSIKFNNIIFERTNNVEDTNNGKVQAIRF